MPFFRLKRALKRAFFGILLFAFVVYVLKLLYNFYYVQSCNENIGNLREEICSRYHQNISIGNFCYDLCETSHVTILECPNYFWHNGKDFVVTVDWRGRKAVLKARDLKNSDPFGTESQNMIENKHFLRGLNDVLKATFVFNLEKNNAKRFTVNDLLPWEGGSLVDSANRTALMNLWLLAQDNEFILSKVLGSSEFTKHSIVFPKIVGSCGHFYLVEYAERILDFSYILPKSAASLTRPYSEKVDIAIQLIKFLQTFESLKTGLQLCDVKFEHFGLFREETSANGTNATSLRMIDSDMIYHSETAREAIVAIKECTNDRDCDFVDCEGQCLTSEGSSYSLCQLNPDDHNLKRICRNMFFMGHLTGMGYSTQLGLLPGGPDEHRDVIDAISKICHQNTFDLNDVDQIYKMLLEVRKHL